MMQTRAEKPKRDFMRRLLVPFALALLIILPVGAENWTQWRGPYFNGSTTELGLPTQWSKTEHGVWVAPMPGYSSATPVVWEDCVFASSPDEQKNLLLLCLDRKTGQVRWKRVVSGGDLQKGRNNMASPSPVTDGKSPMLYGDKLYVQVLQSNPRPDNYSHAVDDKPERESFLLCLDPQTGKDLWRHVRQTDAISEAQEAYSTPIPYVGKAGVEILVLGADYVTAHSPDIGAELWRCGEIGRAHV